MVMTPTAVSGSNIFTSIVAGAFHTCGSTSSAVKCWGGNANGQLGTGTTTQLPRPSPPLSFFSALVMRFVPDLPLRFNRWPRLQLPCLQARTLPALQHQPASAAGVTTTTARCLLPVLLAYMPFG